MPNGHSSLFAAAYLVQGGSLPKMAASGALPLIWHAPKKKSGRRDSPATTGMRQQKEELVHSSRDKPPLNLIARGKSFRLRRSFSRAPVASPVTSFSLLDRARPVFSFSSGRKTGAPARPAAWGEEEGTEQSAVLAVRRGRSGRSFFRRHGGCKGPAIFMAEIHPARRASSSLRTEANSAPPPRSGDKGQDAPHPPLRRAAPSSSARICRLRPCGPLRRPRSRSGP